MSRLNQDVPQNQAKGSMTDKVTLKNIIGRLLICGIVMVVFGAIETYWISTYISPIASFFRGTLLSIMNAMGVLVGVLFTFAVLNFIATGYAMTKLKDEFIPKWLRKYTTFSIGILLDIIGTFLLFIGPMPAQLSISVSIPIIFIGACFLLSILPEKARKKDGQG